MAGRVLRLKGDEVKSELKLFRDTLGQSYGPLGRLCLLCPFAGAALSCSNRAEKILQLLKTNNPVIKLILTSLQLHCQHFKEGCLYAALLTTNLIMRGLELPYPQYKVAMVTGYAMSVVCDWLESDNCPAKRQLSLSSTEELMAIIKTFLGSKLTVYGVSRAQLDHISSLILQGFLRVSPDCSTSSFSFGQHLHVLTNCRHPVHRSQLLEGVVLPVSKEDSVLYALKRCDDGAIVVALFSTSLAGDLEDFPGGVSLEVESNSGISDTVFDDVVMEKLMGVAFHLVQLGVGFVGCQKCVHPKVKDYLRQKGVFVVERLSSLNIGPVQSISGAELIDSFSNETNVLNCRLGKLKELRSLTLLGETYLQLEGVSQHHCSIIVTSHLKMMAEEIAALCNDAVTILEQTLRSPFVLTGGGCMETLAAHHLTQKAKGNLTEDLLTELQCGQNTVREIMLSVAESFVTIATWLEHDKGTVAMDSTFHHCWPLPPLSETTPTSREGSTCKCGAVTSSMLPGDSLLTKVMGGDYLYLTDDKISETVFPLNWPRVADCYVTKLRASELAGDIASTVLRTAWVVVATSTD